ncbi:MAG: DegT/DnrJ/EryC1/StrS aminotransferase family protein [Bacteriovoracaceae bacterium]|nr:DegT/DnrJ/EryC1/StrS aminotransferase family protein [Bacteriovoracaceae bacterium]
MLARGRFYIPFNQLLIFLFRLIFTSMKNTSHVPRFEDKLKKFIQADDVFLFSTCRVSLLAVLKSLGLERKHNVFLAPITIPDIVNAIIISGHNPVFVDMDPDNHGISLKKLKEKNHQKDDIVLVTWLSGLCPDINNIKEYCKQKELILIEDTSQIIGCSVSSQKVGSFGDFNIISFSIGKNISTLLGGAVAVNNPNFLHKMKDISKNFRLHPPQKIYFLKQIFENIKIEILTSKVVFKIFTWPLLLLISILSPERFSNLHKLNMVSKFNPDDVFFDDIPVLRKNFPEEFYFFFNSWMAHFGIVCFSNWDKNVKKRKQLKHIFLDTITDRVQPHIAKSFFHDTEFALRIPVYVDDPEHFQLFLIRRGVDTGGYGLNLCNEEEAFSRYYQDLPDSRFIKNNCFFIDLNHKNSKHDIKRAAEILNRYFSRTFN